MDFNYPVKIKKQVASKNNYIHKFIFSDEINSADFETSSFYGSDDEFHHICVSTMAGCMMGCKICATTHCQKPFQRILTAEEIVAQVAYTIRLRDNSIKKGTKIAVGFMGNGEPLLNFINLRNAIKILKTKAPFEIDEFYLSTIGSKIENIFDLNKIKKGVKIKIQYSYISSNNAKRRRLLPNAPIIGEIVPALDKYAELTGNPIKYNIPLIKGVNDAEEDLLCAAKFINEKPKLRKLKLSSFNKFPGVIYQPCSESEIIDRVSFLRAKNTAVDLFIGDSDQDIYSSCGQMRAEGML